MEFSFRQRPAYIIIIWLHSSTVIYSLEYLISLQQSLLKVVYYIYYVHCLLDIFLEDSFFIAFKYVFFLNSIHLWAVGVQ